MEKLLDLLQEFYGDNRKFSNENGLLTMTNGVENLSGAYAQTYIISLSGGFIKWLVENDKIDLEKAKILKSGLNAELFDYMEWLDGTMEILNYHYFEDYEQILMLLSIQESPIDFLCSILK